jgi:hypothetical protein
MLFFDCWQQASFVHSVILRNWNCREPELINAPDLAYLMEMCQSLKVLTLQELGMDVNQIRLLGTYSRVDLEIVLIRCELTSAGTSALVKVLGLNQGPTKLEYCEHDNIVLANGLRRNNRLKSFEPRISMNHEVGNQEVLAITDALKENKGLVDLSIRYEFVMSNESWDAICDSLKTHPTLQILGL